MATWRSTGSWIPRLRRRGGVEVRRHAVVTPTAGLAQLPFSTTQPVAPSPPPCCHLPNHPSRAGTSPSPTRAAPNQNLRNLMAVAAEEMEGVRKRKTEERTGSRGGRDKAVGSCLCAAVFSPACSALWVLWWVPQLVEIDVVMFNTGSALRVRPNSNKRRMKRHFPLLCLCCSTGASEEGSRSFISPIFFIAIKPGLKHRVSPLAFS